MPGALVWVAAIIGLVALFMLVQFVYLVAVLGWGDEQTRGLAYYGLPPEERAAFKAKLARHARRLRPILALFGKLSRFTYERASFRHAGITGPRGTCTPASFAHGEAYQPRPEDVFVVTQMKCGTTWMQHLVYQVVMRGRGDIVESGRTLYALSPWLEAVKSVPVDEAPTHGEERPTRIIKTHFPTKLCPFVAESRYIYVVRHPVSCFASCADFIATNAGASAPPLEVTEKWYCSDDMWWGPWTDHVLGWWHRSRAEPNVLFVRFEDMKRDLPAIARRVADFLGIAPLSDEELAEVVHKCSFEYMRKHDDAFEMNPPHLIQTNAELFVRGTADRHADVPADMRARILDWCAREMTDGGLPLEELYPETAAARQA